MEPKRPSIPIQVQAFRHRRRRSRWPWALAVVLAALLVIWLASRPNDESASPPDTPDGASQVVGPPWQMGNPEGRFTLTLYADLECPFCREYFPQIKQWVGSNADVVLQWHHLPLAAHEPAASAEARLVECAAEAGGHAAFWQAVEWVYAHTRSDGQGLPDGLRYPESTPAIEQCQASERADAVIRAQTGEAMKGGVTATPSVRLLDRQTGRAVLLQGPIEGDALLSAMDMLAAEDPASDTAAAPATPTSEMPAEVVGDMSR
ncbi:TPA: DsbA family protein [Stenotrophomonas maltophilia]|jgi:protein-disulfide isomerase|uniref:DsbA family protein n=1 Tax=Burkholderia sp. LMG 13014 TaxID=2709306 RepID=UPI001966AB32|nr:DsbA family protein [Burkholderia sp. LMG 13014]HDS1368482.1 thioredoxin domain-containing protein [Stenotrophomonas maltophilia]HEJ3239963.1 thioredoxin domain-containing protein [Pseudomonas aeruginosa]HDS1373201.1 thioredoxin domain-containing protein [Stenotrophomonas maltophilia]HDS1376524.1 thioredoxin domain-containing protein [Stenotrophomonas maltophilia]HDS1381378.1 thioredoxin domain-containing protein [Stenotrophomonas maltophilia]